MKTIAKTPTANKYFSLIFPNILSDFFFFSLQNCVEISNLKLFFLFFLYLFSLNFSARKNFQFDALNWFTFSLVIVLSNKQIRNFPNFCFTSSKNSTNNSVCCLNNEWIKFHRPTTIYIQNFGGRNWFAKTCSYSRWFVYVYEICVCFFASSSLDVIMIPFWLCAVHSWFRLKFDEERMVESVEELSIYVCSFLFVIPLCSHPRSFCTLFYLNVVLSHPHETVQHENDLNTIWLAKKKFIDVNFRWRWYCTKCTGPISITRSSLLAACVIIG